MFEYCVCILYKMTMVIRELKFNTYKNELINKISYMNKFIF